MMVHASATIHKYGRDVDCVQVQSDVISSHVGSIRVVVVLVKSNLGWN